MTIDDLIHRPFSYTFKSTFQPLGSAGMISYADTKGLTSNREEGLVAVLTDLVRSASPFHREHDALPFFFFMFPKSRIFESLFLEIFAHFLERGTVLCWPMVN